MRVCVLNPDYYRSSGVTVAVKRIDYAVRDQNVDSFFVSCDRNNVLQDLCWIKENRLFFFNLMAFNPFVLCIEVLRFLKWMKANDISIVHVHHRRLAIILRVIQLFSTLTFVYTANLTYKFSIPFWIFSPKYAVGITESVLDNLRRTIRIKALDKISNPVLFPELCPRNESLADQSLAICIARLEPIKGHSNLINAWSILAKNGFQYKLLLVGEGSLYERLSSQVNKLGLGSLVLFSGYVSDVVPLIEKSLFSILVSKNEGQGIVTIESASQARATLLTDVDGSRDCFPPKSNLKNLLQFGDIEGLAKVLELWFENPQKTLEEGQIFFDYLKNMCSSENVGRQYAELYARALNSRT